MEVFFRDHPFGANRGICEQEYTVFEQNYHSQRVSLKKNAA